MAKYKIKTHSGSKRRFYVSGGGKIMRRKCQINNARRKKRGATLRLFAGKLAVPKGQAKRIRRLMPYHT
ncbi:MAG: 50S ribosomal protein L35 [Dehalococcoidia bacterium]|nr:MAG: 50S ribosomal protein L35 [Dehalococcoidia bacterium]